MKKLIAATAFAVVAMAGPPAMAFENITPTEPAIACWHKSDVVDVLKAGRMRAGEKIRTTADRLAKAISGKLDRGLCETMAPGQLAFFEEDAENAAATATGIVHIYTPEGADLYAYAPQWRKAF